MVLPEPAAHDPSDQAAGWLDEVALTLRLSSSGALVLIDKARPTRLGDLVRTLRHEWPEIDVIADVGKLVDVAEGSTIVLAPQPEDAPWLNARRAEVRERRLKVVMWCDEAASSALKFQAPDFYDWIGRRKECPDGPPMFAIYGVRAAFASDLAVAWSGSTERAKVEEVLRAAVPTEEVTWVEGSARFDDLVEAMKRPGVVAVAIDGERQMYRARWARAAANRTSKVVLVSGALEAPGFWPVHDRPMGLREACQALAEAGAKSPGRLAALLDLEPEAIVIARALLRGDSSEIHTKTGQIISVYKKPESWLTERAAEDVDGGAALGKELRPSVVGPASSPVLRAMARLARRRSPKVRSRLTWPMQASFDASEPANAVHASLDRSDPSEDKQASPEEREWRIEKILWATPRRFEQDVRPSLLLSLGEDPSTRRALWAIAAGSSLGEGGLVAWLLAQVSSAPLRKAARPFLAALREIDDVAALRGALTSIDRSLRSQEARWRWVARLSLGLLLAPIVAGLVLRANVSIWGVLLSQGELLPLVVTVLLRALAKHKQKKLSELKLPILRTPSKELSEALANIDAEIASGALNNAASRASIALAQVKRLNLPPGHPLTQHALKTLAAAHLAKGERAEALQAIEPIVTAKDTALVQDVALFLARLLAETGSTAGAVRGLLHLTGITLPAAANLRPKNGPSSDDRDDPILVQLASQKAGLLADAPDAHLLLVDTLLKQGRYPEALIVARSASERFGSGKEDAAASLRSRVADLERRLGKSAQDISDT